MCFAIGSSLLFAGNRPACDNEPPTLLCDTVSIRLDPGACVEIQNPCGSHQWDRLDSFRLCEEPNGLFVQTQRNPRARFLCADARISALSDEPVDFFYSTPTDVGVGQFRVSVGATQLAVVASASPANIANGGSSQLDANVTGGVPPYAYAWSPPSGLSSLDIANPVASPSITTQYTVVVTDSTGTTGGGSVIINVGIAVAASASPPAIAPGDSSTLGVLVAGGTPPYSFTWSPAATLSQANIPNPIATPPTRTVYTVQVSDFFGAVAFANITLDVALTAAPSANPVSIVVGAQSQLDVAVAGGSPPYQYDWAPAASLDDSTVQNPVAHPNTTTTYSLTVTDSNGETAMSSVPVAVTAPSLTSCFTVTAMGRFAAQGNASCSLGTITQYRWWVSYRFTGQPWDYTTTGPISPVLNFETPGAQTVRLEVIDSTGATAVSTQTFIAG